MIGWVVFWAFWDAFIKFGVPVFIKVTGSLFEKLYAILNPMGFDVAVGNSPLCVYKAFVTLGAFITGAVTAAVVGLLHRRKVSVTLLLAAVVLADWIFLGITKRPESMGVSLQYFWLNIAMLIAGIVTGGVLCRSHRQPTVTEK
jgi:hypothetical protein